MFNFFLTGRKKESALWSGSIKGAPAKGAYDFSSRRHSHNIYSSRMEEARPSEAGNAGVISRLATGVRANPALTGFY